MKRIEPKVEVERFLETIHLVLRETTNNLYIVKKTGKTDKTGQFMKEYNLTQELVCPSGPESCVEVYIKLKFNGRVICMSFHEKEFEISYPYL